MSNLTRFNSLFDDAFFNDFFRPMKRSEGERMPAIDVHESKDSYLIKVDLPGVAKEDVKISLENGVLTVRGETKREASEQQEGRLIRQERHFGQFLRRLSVGDDVDTEAISARFENGVLNLRLPKRAPQEKPGLEIKID